MERPNLDDWLERSDAVLAEESAKLDELKRQIEQNAIVGEEEQLVYGWFANFRDREKRRELEQ